MLTPNEVHGVMAMMPAFATADAADINATATIDVANLERGLDRMIQDGVDVIATSGSFGEFHTLLWEEFVTLTQTTVEVTRKRVPLFIGCTALNSRDVVRRMEVARDAGAAGVLVGIPFYFPSTVDNAVRFLGDIADLFPTLGIMIYHNPALHHVNLPAGAFERILEHKNIIAMKDSHRDTRAFLKLMSVTKGRLSVFVNAAQLYPYAQLGAAGCWNYEMWMGPWPVLRLRDAVAAGDVATATEIIAQISTESSPPLEWRETAAKLAIRHAGYCDPGPLRPPFVVIPKDVDDRAIARAKHWTALAEKYRPVRAPLAV